MSDQLRTSKKMTIAELENRVVHYERKLRADSTDELYAERRYDALALAWRAAFEWRQHLNIASADGLTEYSQGLRLIERLK